jgi:hypothetical protein
MERSCSNCGKGFCFACGESLPTDQKPNYDPLFHCAELQGVIAGIGLAMVERVLIEQRDENRVFTSASPNKRRKYDLTTPQDSDDGMGFIPDIFKKSKKSKAPKGGIGYAGNHTEDVRVPPGLAHALVRLIGTADHRSEGGVGRATRQRRASGTASEGRAHISPGHEAGRWNTC